MTSAYIHIPFCEQICFYCDFNKVFLEDQPVDIYIESVLKETKQRLIQFPTNEVETLYIGGGTPTSLTSHQLDRLFSGLLELLPYKDGEWTVEVNPGDLDIEKISVLNHYGVNRLSLGVQTFDNHLLKKIGRKHSSQDVYDTLNLIDKYSDIDNITIDLMYALPHQTTESWSDTLNKALDLGLPHIAMYSLILENKTRFANLARKGKLHRPDEETEVWMFEEAKRRFEENGMYQYELSNFAKPGYESQHNLMYWNNENYYGLGAGASGYLGNIRYTNHGPIQHYLNHVDDGEATIFSELLTEKEQMEEQLFLGLRKISGVTYQSFKERFGVGMSDVYGDVIHQLVGRGLLRDNGKSIALTEQGILLGNEVFQEFLIDE